MHIMLTTSQRIMKLLFHYKFTANFEYRICGVTPPFSDRFNIQYFLPCSHQLLSYRQLPLTLCIYFGARRFLKISLSHDVASLALISGPQPISKGSNNSPLQTKLQPPILIHQPTIYSTAGIVKSPRVRPHSKTEQTGHPPDLIVALNSTSVAIRTILRLRPPKNSISSNFLDSSYSYISQCTLTIPTPTKQSLLFKAFVNYSFLEPTKNF